MPTPTLVGVIDGDNVKAVPNIANQAVTGDPTNSRKPPLGRYEVNVVGLSGTGTGNDTVDPNGNQNAFITVVPEVVTYTAGSLDLTYGDGGSVPGPAIKGLFPGDCINLRPVIRRTDPAAHAAAGCCCYPITNKDIDIRFRISGQCPRIWQRFQIFFTKFGNVSNPAAAHGRSGASHEESDDHASCVRHRMATFPPAMRLDALAGSY